MVGIYKSAVEMSVFSVVEFVIEILENGSWN